MSDDFDSFFDESNFDSVEDGKDAKTRSEKRAERPARSRREYRRRQKQKKRRTRTRVIFVVVFLVVAVVATCAVVRVARRVAPTPAASTPAVALDYYDAQEGEEVQFTVNSGEGASTIAQHLVDQEIVKTTEGFINAVNAVNADTKLQPGVFTLHKHMSSRSVVAILTDTSAAQGVVEVRSGERVSEVVRAAAAASKIDESQFQAVIDAGGEGILPAEANGSFEAWLEPGSYVVSDSSLDASAILKMMVDARVAKLDELGVAEGDRERTLTIASIVEKEVYQDEYRGMVARVVENRLAKGMPLGMDSVVAYGLGIEASQLTDAQLSDASNPYNDRINTGLPPTPISIPSDESISAAMSPDEGDWLYFCTVNLATGETKFTASESEFYQFRDEYKSWLAANGLTD